MDVGTVPAGSGREGLLLHSAGVEERFSVNSAAALITRVGEEFDSSQLKNIQVWTSLVVQW